MEEILDLINSETYFMIDIDGVCIDTEERIAIIAKEIGWKEAFKIIDWHEHISSSQQISNSIDILRDVQKKLKRIQLLTQNHTAEEEIEKIAYFRKKGIYIPIISVPSKVSKSVVVPPSFYNGNVVLIDDREKNVIDWNNDGGIGVHFSENNTTENIVKVKSLEFLRKIKWYYKDV